MSLVIPLFSPSVMAESMARLLFVVFVRFSLFSNLWRITSAPRCICCIVDMFSMLSRKMVCMGIDMWKVLNQKVSYQELMQIQDFRGLKEKTKALLKDVTASVEEKRNVSSKKIVEEAIQYMKKHYSEDISLEKIANRFFLNQTYFSRLFKQYTGSTFTDYLIELRMEKAKELLGQGKYKVYEVSQMIGYRSEKYFFRVFKQYTGCSPTEYYRGKKLDEQ